MNKTIWGRQKPALVLGFVSLAGLMTLSAHAQSFSCRIGTEPACLSYGDTVCSSLGKCVDRDASCFEKYQCNYEGFTCKSNLTECADDYDTLVEKHNRLAREYNDLLEKQKAVRTCLRYASSLLEAQNCPEG